MNEEILFTIDIKELDNPFEREKLESLPNYILVELLIRHLKREIKAIEYIKDNKVYAELEDYMKNGDYYVKVDELLEILGDKE